MTDLDIFCNFHKCRKRLNTTAWVTSCSHAFCEEDGNRAFSDSNNNECPACNTRLPNKYDVVKVDLNPSQQFRSMVLAGLRPEIVIEIAHRAIAFWNYQVYMEHVYQTKCNEVSRENLSQMEQYYEHVVAKLKTQVQSYGRKLENMKKELQGQIDRAAELMDRINEKQRENNELHAMYESLKRTQLKYMKENQVPNSMQIRTKQQSKHQYSVGPRTLDEMVNDALKVPETIVQQSPRYKEKPQEAFEFKPVTPTTTVRKQFLDPCYIRKKQKIQMSENQKA
ncbi:E3 ubiquitin-protein ligase CCNB1IP1 [Anabrus simplex]|uniref:E3 ubiquitin-protein ligase CCNB1IP1 n=1 Tax=Anabrus simplex TaxID=316456 RepID=UPI0034DD43F8